MTPLARVLLACGFAGALARAEVRDPFLPPESASRRTPLERLDPGTLRVVALVYGAHPRALLQAADGTGHIAAVDMAIGPRGGRVVAIEGGAVRIREPDARDDLVLRLPAPERAR
jgi:Tfp pilus assembly protein PilP